MIAADITHILDNPVWSALTSNHASFASGTDLVKRYPPEVAPFGGMAERSDAAYRDLAQIMPPDEWIALVGINLPAELPGWATRFHITVNQMVSTQPIEVVETEQDILDLSAADVPDMLKLIEIAQPGPFFSRTVEMGHYLGIRQNGQLVAMAGERIRPSGACEISAVCTHPDFRGRGYAELLISRIAAWNRARGDLPFLHVARENANAIRLYERLGFRQRAEINILVVSH